MTDIKQDTSAAATQALQDQAPGSEFSPLPHPDEARIVAALAECERKQTELFKKLYSGEPGTYMDREKWHQELDAVDREAAEWRGYAAAIALGYRTSAPGHAVVGY